MTEEPTTLADVRRRIDRLDDELVALVARREALVRRAGQGMSSARAVRAPGRVEEVVARARTAAAGAGASPALVERIYRAMIAAFVDRELAATGFADGPGIEPAVPADAGELLTLQRAAYTTEARRYGDPELPPLVQTLPELVDELRRAITLKATRGGRVVGAVRGRVDSGVLHVGRLTVAPDQQRQGIGAALLGALEARARPEAHRAALFTGDRSAENLRLYARLGYGEERREPLGRHVVLVHLAKDLPDG